MKKTLLALVTTFACCVQAEEQVKPLTLDGEFGLILTTGNTKTTSFKTKLSSQHELENWSNDYIAKALYQRDEVQLSDGTEESQTSAQEFFLSAQANYKLENPDHRLFAFGSFEDNRSKPFDYQATLAGGWSQKMWDDESGKFEYSIGPGYSIAETRDGESANGIIARGALDYKWVISENATFRQMLSTEVGSDNTKTKSETSVSAQINGSLAMKLSLTLDHNSETTDDTESLDTQTAVTLVYNFF